MFISLCFVLGKSNLMDAISFVLGEKTSNLRVKSLKVNCSMCIDCFVRVISIWILKLDNQGFPPK